MTGMDKQARTRRTDAGGFTLVEATIALTVLMFFLISLSGLAVSALRLVRSMETRYPETPTTLFFNTDASPWERRFGVSAVLSPTQVTWVSDTNPPLRTVQVALPFTHNRVTGDVVLHVTATEPLP